MPNTRGFYKHDYLIYNKTLLRYRPHSLEISTIIGILYGFCSYKKVIYVEIKSIHLCLEQQWYALQF
jgi:hypothetical protein